MYLLIKPASGACNLRCKYCFYADEMTCREQALRPMMKINTFENIIKKATEHIRTLPADGKHLSIGFQGGEPMLAGLDFFRSAVDVARKYTGDDISLSLFLQTNGTLIDVEWAAFLALNKFLVGLSLDGTAELHNKNRVDAKGKGTHRAVLRAESLLRAAGCEFNILTVLTGENARSASTVYNFFKNKNFAWQQYIPCIAPLGGADTPWTLSAERYGEFLCRLFDLWYADLSAGNFVYNREFENYIAILAGLEPEDCGMRGECSLQYLIESDGSVYPCDFYALDEFYLGNLDSDSFSDIDQKRTEIGFIEKSHELPDECKACRWYPLCRGGCRRNRDENGKNRFCSAYKRLFEYAAPRMDAISRSVKQR